MNNLILVILGIYAQTYLLFNGVPLLISSYVYVQKFEEEFKSSNLHPHKLESAEELIKKLSDQCSSDSYIIIDQKGLEVGDLNFYKRSLWKNLRTILTMSSTIIGLPWVEKTINLNQTVDYILKKCDAELIIPNKNYGIKNYIDTKKKIIKIEFEKLPTDKKERDQNLKKLDEILYNIFRKLPTPKISIIMTSSMLTSSHSIPVNRVKEMPNRYEIFNDILNHHNRIKIAKNEHDFFPSNKTEWTGVKDTFQRHTRIRKNSRVSLFNLKLLNENKKTVIIIITSTTCIILTKTWKLLRFLKEKQRKIKKIKKVSKT